jgi:ketosteroid isomerase-like protein
MTQQDLVEIERIKQLKARYFQLMDQKRWEEWQMVFTEDAVIDTSEEGSPIIHGRQAFYEFLPPILENVKTCHHGHTPVIRLTAENDAEGTWAMEDMLWWPEGSPMRHLWGLGWYNEKYRREADGEWRIAHLELRRIRVEVDGKEVGLGDRPASGDRTNAPD